MSYKHIFVAIDSSELSDRVFSQALELATAVGARIKLFHCLADNLLQEPGMPLPIELGVTPELIEQAYKVQQRRGEQHRQEVEIKLRSYCQRAAKQGITAEFDCLIAEEPGLAICEASQQWGADLIVLGRRGLTGWAEALLGSVSNYVLHHACCCVLVVQESVVPQD